MEIVNALFNPHGTLRGQPYWLGAIILILVAALFQYWSYAAIANSEGMEGLMRGSTLGMLSWLLLYPYFCLYGKRLRDMGHPATWFLLILFIYVIVSGIIQTFVSMPAMFGEFEGLVEQMEKTHSSANEDGTPDISGMMDAQLDMQRELVKKTMWPILISGAIISAVFSGILGVLKPKLEGNPFLPSATHLD